MSSDDGIHVVQTDEGYEVRHWMGESQGVVIGTYPELEEAIKNGKKIAGRTEYGFSFSFRNEKPSPTLREIQDALALLQRAGILRITKT